MSYSTVAWHHTGRPSWAAAGWNDRMGRFARHSKTHLHGQYGSEDHTTNVYGEDATLCGVTVPRGHMCYQIPRGSKPSRLYPLCGSCKRIAKARGIDVGALLATMEESRHG